MKALKVELDEKFNELKITVAQTNGQKIFVQFVDHTIILDESDSLQVTRKLNAFPLHAFHLSSHLSCRLHFVASRA